jgi:hypothetical protein
MSRLFLVTLAASLATQLASAQEADVNPFKTARIGDFASYATTTKFEGRAALKTVTYFTVRVVTAKQVTIGIGGKDRPDSSRVVIDLARPFEPLRLYGTSQVEGKVPPAERLAEGKERLVIESGTYDTTWTTYRTTEEDGEQVRYVTDTKIWVEEGVPHGLRKYQSTTTVNGKPRSARTMVYLESGSRQ